MPTVALATCAAFPAGDEDAPLLDPELRAVGVEPVWAVWDDERVDWNGFDLVVVRATWDYAERRDAFLAWADRVPRLANTAEVLRWSTDKELYLDELTVSGVPTVPTVFVPPGRALRTPDEPFVVKPAVGAGGRDAARFARGDPAAAALVARIHTTGRTALVQPFVEGSRERALVFLDGAYSHSFYRGAELPVGERRDVLYIEEELALYEATAEERVLAAGVLDVAARRIPGNKLSLGNDEPFLYARVDLLGGMVLEVELVEPSLYLSFHPGAARAFAAAIGRRCTVSRSS